jgi:hypothetical protein
LCDFSFADFLALRGAEQKNRIQIWLYDQVNTRIEGDIIVRWDWLMLCAI